MNEELILYKIIPTETLVTEYKNWTLKYISMNVWYPKDTIKHIITSGQIPLDFDIITDHNLYQYLLCYVPKYVSVFGNAFDIDFGELFIGISDAGEVVGIPRLSELTYDIIDEWLLREHHLIKQMPQTVSSTDIFNLIKFEIITVEIPSKNSFVDYETDEAELTIRISNAKHKRSTCKKIYKNYIQKKRTWSCLMQKYSCSIFVVANDPYFRKSLTAYIAENCPESKLIKELETDTKYEVYSGEEISIKKEDINDIYYWITRYKDAMIMRIKQFRPVTIGHLKRKNIYNSLLLQLSSLRGRFIANNKNIKYYVIKITFPTKLGNIYYRDGDNWTSRQRQIINGEPGCA